MSKRPVKAISPEIVSHLAEKYAGKVAKKIIKDISELGATEKLDIQAITTQVITELRENSAKYFTEELGNCICESASKKSIKLYNLMRTEALKDRMCNLATVYFINMDQQLTEYLDKYLPMSCRDEECDTFQEYCCKHMSEIGDIIYKALTNGFYIPDYVNIAPTAENISLPAILIDKDLIEKATSYKDLDKLYNKITRRLPDKESFKGIAAIVDYILENEENINTTLADLERDYHETTQADYAFEEDDLFSHLVDLPQL